ncbi:MAG: hypothetical protein WA867_02565 [Candidatus Acidiferrales bacterium]
MASCDARNADDILIAQFEDASLPLENFHHCVHVQIVFLYLSKLSLLEVLARFPTALRRYAEAHGKHGLYNETISWAYILLINERVRRTNRKLSWDEFRSQNPDLLTWKDSVLQKYYRAETLSSELAKGTFLFPDKIFAEHDSAANRRQLPTAAPRRHSP